MTVTTFEHCPFIYESNILCSFEAFALKLNLSLSDIETFFMLFISLFSFPAGVPLIFSPF